MSTQSRDVPLQGDISTLGEWGSEALAPGVIGSRLVGFRASLQSLVSLFGIYDTGLFGLFVEDGVIQRFALVADGDVSVCIQADGYSGVTHGIRGAMGLDLIDGLVKLKGQVFGEAA